LLVRISGISRIIGRISGIQSIPRVLSPISRSSGRVSGILEIESRVLWISGQIFGISGRISGHIQGISRISSHGFGFQGFLGFHVGI